MARFLNNLKQKTVAGSRGPSSSELQSSGETIFLENPNTNFQVLNVVALTIKNNSGSDASVQINLTDGSTSLTLAAGTVGDGGELPVITPLNMTSALGAGSSSSGLMIDSTLYLTVASNQAVVANVAYQVLSVA
jgi:hypothetical protein